MGTMCSWSALMRLWLWKTRATTFILLLLTSEKAQQDPYLQSVASRPLSSHSCWGYLGTFRGSSLTLGPLSAHFFDPENLLDLTHTIRPIPSDFLSKLWKNFASLSKLFFWSHTLTVAMEKLTEPVSIKQTQSLPVTGITQCIFSPGVFWHLIWRGRQHGKNLGLAIRRATTHWLWNHRQVTSFLWTSLFSISKQDSFSKLVNVFWRTKWKGTVESDIKCERTAHEGRISAAPFHSAKYNFFVPLSVTSHASKSVSFPSQHLRTRPSSFPSLLTPSTNTSPLPHGWRFLLPGLPLSYTLFYYTQSKTACSIRHTAFGSSCLSSVMLWCRLPSDETIVFMVLHHLYRNCVLSPLLACFLIYKAKNTYLTVWL